MKTFALIAIAGVIATAFFAFNSAPSSAVEEEFRSFLETYRNGYGTAEEYSYRLGVFAENLDRIAELNAQNPEATFAVNQFADRTPEEMTKMMGYNGNKNVVGTHVPPRTATDQDWTNMWGKIKNQGQCGSCWAFSATAAFESRYALNNGKQSVDTYFSEQELVDCDPQSSGCNGGLMDYAFEYLETQGFCTEDQYPYTARDGSCKASSLCGSGPTDKAYTDFPSKNEDAVLNGLAQGPVAVAVDASSWSFYSGGVLSRCGKGLNHGVTLVKYDSAENSVTIRNSWGSSWGEKGLIRLKVGQDTCGYADDASVPTF